MIMDLTDLVVALEKITIIPTRAYFSGGRRREVSRIISTKPLIEQPIDVSRQ